MNREQLLKNAGCFSARKGAWLPDGKRGWCAAYVASEQGIFEDNYKYLVICEEHNTNVSIGSKKQAISIAGHGEDFCDDCRANAPK